MFNTDMPVIIPLLATGYLLTIYLLLMLAQRTTKGSRYVANSAVDAYAPYVATEQSSKTDEVERWSLHTSQGASLAYFPKGKSLKRIAKEGEPNSSDQLEVAASKETGN
jgi:hypothetical protein